MIRLDKEKVLLLHQILIEQTGGEDGVRDMGLLESALAACDATFDDKELFPAKEEKAARLCTGLISNHAFVDGNKRRHLCDAHLSGSQWYSPESDRRRTCRRRAFAGAGKYEIRGIAPMDSGT